MSIKALQNQLGVLRRDIEAHVGYGENALEDPEWPTLRAIVLRETEPWPEVHAAMEEACTYLGSLARCVWRQYPLRTGNVSMFQVLFDAIKENMSARVAVAAALMEESKRKERVYEQ